MARITGLRAVEFDVLDLEGAVRFYTEVWNLTLVEIYRGSAFLRATGPYHHVLKLTASSRPAIANVVLAADDKGSVEKLHGAITAAGLRNIEAPVSLSGPGGGYGFGFKDPEGRNFVIVTGVADYLGRCEDRDDYPRKLAHANLNAEQCDVTCRFLMEVLGFKLSDETVMARFLRCDSAHNALVIGQKGPVTLNHVAFEMPDLDSVMRGAGRMKDNGYPIEWGIGRHGPGNNVFAYFLGPEEFPLEYTAETMQVDDSHTPRGPDYWTWPPGRSDRWGVTEPLSKRFVRIQSKFRFSPDGFTTRNSR